jgi:putative DNA primase/helicase
MDNDIFEAEKRAIGFMTKAGELCKIADDDSEPKPVCSNIDVLADARDWQANGWSKLIQFKDRDGNEKRVLLPNRLFASRDGREVTELLYDKGLTIQKPKLTIEYLRECETKRRALIVNCTGWNDNKYIFSNSEILGETDEMVYYDGDSSTDFDCAGTLDDWRDNIGKYCAGNSRLILAVCTAFASTLLNIIGQDNGGFHFVGKSQTGKSTALKVACSVFGGKDYIKQWRATDNGLEGTASNRNDALLVLDEIGQMDDGAKIGEVVYMLGNNKGKARANRNGDLRAPKQFTLLFLSSGEKTLSDCMTEARKTLKAGQAVRMLDIPVNQKNGLFDELHDKKDGAELSNYLKEQVLKYYGTPARAFINAIIKDGKDTVKQDFKEKQSEWTTEYLKKQKDVSGQVNSAFMRFALAAYAGEYATANNLTGWQQGEALSGCLRCFDDWIEQRGGFGDQENDALLAQVKMYFEQNGSSQFDDVKTVDAKVINRAGYKEKISDETKYYVFTETFNKKICAGFNPKQARSVLYKKGWLDYEDSKQKNINGNKRFYVFNSKMFESEL